MRLDSKKETGDSLRDIKSTRHQIYISSIVLKGQKDIYYLLNRICRQLNDGILTWDDISSKADGTIRQGDSTDSDRYARFSCTEKQNKSERNNDAKGDRLQANGLFENQIDSSGLFLSSTCNEFEKEAIFQTEDPRYSIVAFEPAMPLIEEYTLDEETLESFIDIANVDDIDDAILREISLFEEDFENKLQEAENNLREQLLINLGYRFLVTSTKLRIFETEKEITKERKQAKLFNAFLKNDGSLRNGKRQKYIPSEEADKECWKERNEYLELLRVRETIMMVECMIEQQKEELEMGERLLKDFDLCIAEKNRKIEELGNFSAATYKATNPTACMKSDTAIQLGPRPDCGSLLDERKDDTGINIDFAFDSPYNGGNLSVRASLGENKASLIKDDSNNNTNSNNSSKSNSNNNINSQRKYSNNNDRGTTPFLESQLSKKSNTVACSSKNILFETSSQSNVQDLFSDSFCDLNAVCTEFLSSHYLNQECELWIRRLQMQSRIMKISIDTNHEYKSPVKNAPRVLGRSRNGKFGHLIKDAIYHTNAVAV